MPSLRRAITVDKVGTPQYSELRGGRAVHGRRTRVAVCCDDLAHRSCAARIAACLLHFAGTFFKVPYEALAL